MTSVKFVFDKEKDLFNIWQTCSSKSYGHDFSAKMPKFLVDYCKKRTYAQSKKFIENAHSRIYKSGQMEFIARTMNSAWEMISKEYFKRLERVTGRKLNVKIIRAYPTLASRYPYSWEDNTFMFGFFQGIPSTLLVAGHEIMHLHFHEHYFRQVMDEVGYKRTHDIKEALTVLLDLEFKDLWFLDDGGYDSHKKLRTFIMKQWKKSKDFDKLLKSCIEFVRKEDKKRDVK